MNFPYFNQFCIIQIFSVWLVASLYLQILLDQERTKKIQW